VRRIAVRGKISPMMLLDVRIAKGERGRISVA
jgi:hypothetical protein